MMGELDYASEYPEVEPERAKKCETCGYPLLPYNPGDTSTWRKDNFCSARCKRRAKRKIIIDAQDI